MKNLPIKLLAGIAVCVILLISMCSGGHDENAIKTVKDSVRGADRTISLAQAFENSGLFSSVEWSSEKVRDGAFVVKATCKPMLSSRAEYDALFHQRKIEPEQSFLYDFWKITAGEESTISFTVEDTASKISRVSQITVDLKGDFDAVKSVARDNFARSSHIPTIKSKNIIPKKIDFNWFEEILYNKDGEYGNTTKASASTIKALQKANKKEMEQTKKELSKAILERIEKDSGERGEFIGLDFMSETLVATVKWRGKTGFVILQEANGNVLDYSCFPTLDMWVDWWSLKKKAQAEQARRAKLSSEASNKQVDATKMKSPNIGHEGKLFELFVLAHTGEHVKAISFHNVRALKGLYASLELESQGGPLVEMLFLEKGVPTGDIPYLAGENADLSDLNVKRFYSALLCGYAGTELRLLGNNNHGAELECMIEIDWKGLRGTVCISRATGAFSDNDGIFIKGGSFPEFVNAMLERRMSKALKKADLVQEQLRDEKVDNLKEQLELAKQELNRAIKESQDSGDDIASLVRVKDAEADEWERVESELRELVKIFKAEQKRIFSDIKQKKERQAIEKKERQERQAIEKMNHVKRKLRQFVIDSVFNITGEHVDVVKWELMDSERHEKDLRVTIKWKEEVGTVFVELNSSSLSKNEYKDFLRFLNSETNGKEFKEKRVENVTFGEANCQELVAGGFFPQLAYIAAKKSLDNATKMKDAALRDKKEKEDVRRQRKAELESLSANPEPDNMKHISRVAEARANLENAEKEARLATEHTSRVENDWKWINKIWLDVQSGEHSYVFDIGWLSRELAKSDAERGMWWFDRRVNR